jgi:hypothetical protein
VAFVRIESFIFLDAQSKFHRVDAIHVYSLSPSPIQVRISIPLSFCHEPWQTVYAQDAGLLCGPTAIVRQVDNSKKGMELAATVGKVVSKQVQVNSPCSTVLVQHLTLCEDESGREARATTCGFFFQCKGECILPTTL